MSAPVAVEVYGDPTELVIEEEHIVLELWAGFPGANADASHIRGIPVSAVAPSSGFALVYNGTAYVPANIATQVELDAVSTALTGHVADISNPHAVTAAQVGLGLVENTALSTWAGSGNITTLGTIATGVWNATAVAWAKVDKTGSSLADLATRSATDLTSGNLDYLRLPSAGGTWAVGGSLIVSVGSTFQVTNGPLAAPRQLISAGTAVTATIATANPQGTGTSISPLVQAHATDATASSGVYRWSANANGSAFIGTKSRTNTLADGIAGTRTAVVANDVVLDLLGAADDGTDLFTKPARIRFAVDGAVSTSRVPGRITLDVAAGAADDDIATVVTVTAAAMTMATAVAVITAASSTTRAGLRLPHGAAPTSPVNGDLWTTSAGGPFWRINGATLSSVVAANATKTTAAAPYANDGYITVTIGGTSVRLMTTA